MGYKVVISPRALGDLKAAVFYIARDNPSAALKFGEQLRTKAEELAEFPRMGRQLPEGDDPNLRDFPFKSYRIIYEVHDDRQLIAILRFWHSARGQPELK